MVNGLYDMTGGEGRRRAHCLPDTSPSRGSNLELICDHQVYKDNCAVFGYSEKKCLSGATTGDRQARSQPSAALVRLLV